MPKLQIKTIARRLFEGDYQKITIDSRAITKGDIFLALPGEHVHGNSFIESALKKGAALVIADAQEAHPSQRNIIAHKDPALFLTQIAAEILSLSSAQRFAITGSNGKTTTKDMAACILGSRRKVLTTLGNFNNQLGVPLTLSRLKKHHQIAVIEIGTSFPGEIELLTQLVQPDISVLTSVNAAHLSGFKNLSAIALEKSHIFSSTYEGSTALLHEREFNENASVQKALKGKKVHLINTLEKGNLVSKVRLKSGRISFSYKGSPLTINTPAFHNIENACTAISLGEQAGIPLSTIIKRLATWQPPAHRMNIFSWKKRKVIDDCYNANPTSVLSALKTAMSLKMSKRQKVFVAFGDMKELGRRSSSLHRELGSKMAQMGVEVLLTLGKEARATLKTYDYKGGACSRHFNDTNEMASFLQHFTKPHDIILVKGSRSMHLEQVVDTLLPSP